ncbi:hypothetical protein GCM10009754_11780 [Amycolatopsis minnesotensis]|uniref:Uncharacterized protein n=1 Tax=Amycolatopsis minnesotensis TaxID=337894 RepID=A0ABN2Q6W7_9PSEU
MDAFGDFDATSSPFAGARHGHAHALKDAFAASDSLKGPFGACGLEQGKPRRPDPRRAGREGQIRDSHVSEGPPSGASARKRERDTSCEAPAHALKDAFGESDAALSPFAARGMVLLMPSRTPSGT